MSDTKTTQILFEHFTAFWLVATGAFTVAAAWVTTVLLTREAAKRVKEHELRFVEMNARVTYLEINCVLHGSCKASVEHCKDDREAIAESTNGRLDKIMDMFAKLEERRNERWLDFEHRRELSKTELQKTLTDMTKQLSCLQGIISERDKRFRKTNGDHE
jgi:hypothetical protein